MDSGKPLMDYILPRNIFGLISEGSKDIETKSSKKAESTQSLHGVADRIQPPCLEKESTVFTVHATQSAAMPQYIVCPSATFRHRDHIGWNSSKVISRPNS